MLLFALLFTAAIGKAQTVQQLSLEQAVQLAAANNRSVKAVDYEKQYQQQIKASAGYIGKTDIGVMIGQYNSYKWGDNYFTVSQTIPNPKNFSSQKALGDELIKSADYKKIFTVNELTWNVKQVYYQLMYLHGREQLLKEQDSIYNEFLKSASLRFKTGESNLLEKATAETQLTEIRNQQQQNGADIQSYNYALQQLTGTDTAVNIIADSLEERNFALMNDTAAVNSNPYLAYLQQQINVLQKERDVVAAQRLPDFTFGYFNQSLIGNPVNETGKLATGGNRFQGFNAGIALSIFNKPIKARIKAAEINKQAAENDLMYNQSLLQSQWQQAIQQYLKDKSSVSYYRSSALKNADLILRQAKLGYQQGDTDYAEYLLAIRNALQIKENYLQNLNQLNQSIIQLEYLAGNQ